MVDTTIPRQIAAASTPVTVIKATRGWVGLHLRELWAYREMLFFLIYRDVAVRYKQTLLGIAWAIIQPFTTMVVFSIFFGRLAQIPSDGIPYPLFSFAALVPWAFFANAITTSSNSLVTSANLIKKIYFPRLIVPLASVLGGLPDFVVAFTVLLGMMLVFGVLPIPAALVWLPLFLLLAMITALGIGLWLSALNVQYRDVRYLVPFMMQFWLYITPIAYPSSLLPEPFRTLYGLNPMVGVVEGFRWALLSGAQQVNNFWQNLPLTDWFNYLQPTAGNPPGLMTLISAIMALLLLISGAFYFRRMEKSFADVV